MAEALQLQLDVQRRLHEQLEVCGLLFLCFSTDLINSSFLAYQVQRNLQLQIEEQGKQLKKMLDSSRNQTTP